MDFVVFVFASRLVIACCFFFFWGGGREGRVGKVKNKNKKG